jgi:chromosome segregation ATPase
MTTERWDDEKLDKLAAIVQQSVVASNERMARFEQQLAQLAESKQASDERLTRIEQIVESNNRFLESFSQDIKNYTNSMNNIATRMDGIIATSNYDRQDVTSKLSRIQNQVSAIGKHLGAF